MGGCVGEMWALKAAGSGGLSVAAAASQMGANVVLRNNLDREHPITLIVNGK